MREKMGEQFEKAVVNCKRLKDLRDKCFEHRSDVSSSFRLPKDLIRSIMVLLELKGRKFNVFESASDNDMDQFFSTLLKVDSLITKDSMARKSVEKLACLQAFFSHCCLFRKYALTIRKCGKSDCSICSPVRMDQNVFKGENPIPIHLN